MFTECINCSGAAKDFCNRAYKVSAQKVSGCAEDLVLSAVSEDSSLKVIGKTRANELASLTYISTVELIGCSLTPYERALRLDEAIVEAGDTLSPS